MYSAQLHAELLRRKAGRVFGTHRPDALFQALSPEGQALTRVRAGDRGQPILALDDGTAWIVLTDSHLVGGSATATHAVDLTALTHGYEVRSSVGAFDKALASQVSFEAEGAWFQAPSAADLALLLNVLQIVFRRSESDFEEPT